MRVKGVQVAWVLGKGRVVLRIDVEEVGRDRVVMEGSKMGSRRRDR